MWHVSRLSLSAWDVVQTVRIACTLYDVLRGKRPWPGHSAALLASAIGKMDYLRGYRGWRWIFILEGTATVLIGIVFLFTFPNFPEQSTRLTMEEQAYVKARLKVGSRPQRGQSHGILS